MKKTNLLLIAVLIGVAASTQQKQSIIKQGSVLKYNVQPNGGFLTSSLLLEELSADTTVFMWHIEGSAGRVDRSGKRSMGKASIETSKKGYWLPPYDGEDIVIPEDQNMLSVSKTLFNDLKTTGKMEFDGQTFLPKGTNGSVEYEVNGKKFNAIRADTENGNTRLWILDDATFPLILKLEGNPFGVDIELTDIK